MSTKKCTPESHRALSTGPRRAWIRGTAPLPHLGERPIECGLELANCRRCRSTIARRVQDRRSGVLLLGLVLLVGCTAAPLPIVPDDGGTASADLLLPRCGATGGITSCGVDVPLAVETSHGIEGPPSKCYVGKLVTQLCAPDPTDVPAGYPYVVVPSCADCP